MAHPLLTRQQFHQARPHGSYSAYQRYVQVKRQQRAQAARQPIDPFAGVSEHDIQQRGSVVAATYKDQQIQQRAGTEARAQISPLLKEISDEISRRSAAEQQHLAGATQNYQQQVAQYAPQVQQAYGGERPGIAAATGLQRSGETAGKYAEMLNTRTGEAQAQLPALIQGLVDSLRSRDEGRRQNRAQLASSERDRALNAAVFGKEYGIKQKTAQSEAKYRQAQAQTSAQRARTSAQSAAETARHNRQQEAKDAANLGITVAELHERQRHNAATEAQAQAAAEAQGRQVDEAASRSRGILIGKDGKPILKYEVKNGKRVKGSGRRIPFKEKPSKGSGPPPGSPKAK